MSSASANSAAWDVQATELRARRHPGAQAHMGGVRPSLPIAMNFAPGVPTVCTAKTF